MDRDRLKEVHKTETTESRVNEDFVDWLKTKGPTWLLLALIVMTLYLGSIRWRESRAMAHINAWQEMSSAEMSQALPATFEDVAEQFPKVDSIAVLARLRSAQRLLQAVQTGTPLAGADTAEEPEGLSDLDREQYLARADRQYQAVLEQDNGSFAMTLHAVNALNGRAAVAEARGDTTAAQQHYNAAAARAEKFYPHLARQARDRAGAVDQLAFNLTLPTSEEADARREIGDGRPAFIEPALRDLILPSP
jgi:hypothetical protein